MDLLPLICLLLCVPVAEVTVSKTLLNLYTALDYYAMPVSNSSLFDRESALKATGFSTNSAANRCLLSLNYDHDDSPTLTSICSSTYPGKEIALSLNKSYKRKIVDINCKSNATSKKSNVCICSDVQICIDKNNKTKPDCEVVESSYSPGCINHNVTLKKEHFQGQKHLQVLALAHVPVVSISPGCLDDLPALQFVSLANNSFSISDLPRHLFCKNIMLAKLHLQDMTLSKFPSQLFNCPPTQNNNFCLPRLTDVIIEHTGIKVLPENPFGCARNIAQLLLPHNKLKDISNLCTTDMQSVYGLQLHDNYISKLKPYMFRNLTRLTFLELSHNLITTVKGIWFEKAVSLSVICLDHNLISHLDGSLASLPLFAVSIGYNKLRYFPVNFINGSRSLDSLDLQANDLSDFAIGSLDGLDQLFYLNASANNLSSVATLAKAFLEPSRNLSIMLLHDNKVKELGERDFKFFPEVTHLVLNNNAISKLHPFTFSHLCKLTDLYLENNVIAKISTQLSYLKNLDSLYLTDNKIRLINSKMFQGLFLLDTLEMSNNSIIFIDKFAFRDLNVLNYLNMDSNYIEHIDRNVIPASVETFKFSDNRLRDMPCMTSNNNLTYLFLDYNAVTTIKRRPECIFAKLQGLSLAGNGISILEPDAFKTASNLLILNLNDNKLSLNFSINYFGDIYKLRQLYLPDNQIRSIENVFYHQPMAFLKVLDLKRNPITAIPSQPEKTAIKTDNFGIQVLVLSSCNITTIDQNAFFNFEFAQEIILSDNFIDFFPNLNLHQTSTQNGLTIDVSDNLIDCSCKMKWLRQNITLNQIYRLEKCYYHINDSIIEFWELPEDQFLCKTENMCDNTLCTCYSTSINYQPSIANCSGKNSQTFPVVISDTNIEIYLHDNDYQEINLKETYPQTSFQARILTLYGCHVKRIKVNSFDTFKYLEELYLHDNQIKFLPKQLFAHLTLLKVLTLHNNLLLSLNKDILSDNKALTLLQLHNNRLHSLSNATKKVITDMFYLKAISLHNNPWICQCDNMSLKSWLNDLDLQQKLVNVQDIRCENGTSVLSTSDAIFRCSDNSVNADNQGFIIAVTLSVVLPMVVFIIMAMTYYHRHFLAVLVFNFSGIRFRKQKKTENSQYDAIILYDDEPSDDDYQDVMSGVRHLYDWMKGVNPPYKVMMPAIDIDGGVSWADEITRGLYASNKSVIFLSAGFIQKRKTMYLFDESYNLALERRSSDLILVIDRKSTLNYIKSKDVTDQRLKAFLRTKNYLLFSDKYFYKKLMYLLPGNVRRVQPLETGDYVRLEEI